MKQTMLGTQSRPTPRCALTRTKHECGSMQLPSPCLMPCMCACGQMHRFAPVQLNFMDNKPYCRQSGNACERPKCLPCANFTSGNRPARPPARPPAAAASSSSSRRQTYWFYLSGCTIGWWPHSYYAISVIVAIFLLPTKQPRMSKQGSPLVPHGNILVMATY